MVAAVAQVVPDHMTAAGREALAQRVGPGKHHCPSDQQNQGSVGSPKPSTPSAT